MKYGKERHGKEPVHMLVAHRPSSWDEDYLHEEVQAYIEFEKNGKGEFQFGYVQKQMDSSLWNYRRSVQVE
jgi:hypothetical protein